MPRQCRGGPYPISRTALDEVAFRSLNTNGCSWPTAAWQLWMAQRQIPERPLRDARSHQAGTSRWDYQRQPSAAPRTFATVANCRLRTPRAADALVETVPVQPRLKIRTDVVETSVNAGPKAGQRPRYQPDETRIVQPPLLGLALPSARQTTLHLMGRESRAVQWHRGLQRHRAAWRHLYGPAPRRPAVPPVR
jgi:hypothetical protein